MTSLGHPAGNCAPLAIRPLRLSSARLRPATIGNMDVIATVLSVRRKQLG